jgi:hypothetical protein
MLESVEGPIMRYTMRKFPIMVGSTLRLALIGAQAQANTLRCERDLVSRGDNQDKVLAV